MSARNDIYELTNPTGRVYIPDGCHHWSAMPRCTHIGIGAHQDDLEIMAYPGIRQCYRAKNQFFGGIVCTDGGGSPRAGEYEGLSDLEMNEVRKAEQEKAADIGEYSFIAQLDYPSSEVKDPDSTALKDELTKLLSFTQPGVIYTHNPADKHETHIAVTVAVIEAVRSLPSYERPIKIYGGEVWRDLDWLMDKDKIALDVSDDDGLGKRLIDVFESQITGGKRYDLATLGRRQANATYFRSHETDNSGHLLFAMDLTPLAKDDSIDILDYVMDHVRRFQQDVENNLKRYLSSK